MFLRSAGLATHIMNNQIKSVILLMGFPFLLLLMLAGFFASMSALQQASGVYRPVVEGANTALNAYVGASRCNGANTRPASASATVVASASASAGSRSGRQPAGRRRRVVVSPVRARGVLAACRSRR